MKRFEQHNSAESNFTKSGIPWKMLWYTIKTNKKEAEILERKIKKLSRDKKIKFIEKYESGIDDYDLFFQIKFNRKRKK